MGADAAMRVDVIAGTRCIATWPLAGTPCDLGLVDALARLQLAALGRGWRLRLRNPSEELRDLLELVGLAEVLALEPRR